MIFIISDVHGCFFTLLKLVDRIRNIDSGAQFIFLGDYFDRGLYSKQVVDYVIQMKKEGAICLRGNHDDVMNYMFNRQNISYRHMRDITNERGAISWWNLNGFKATLRSYEISPYDERDLLDIPKILKGLEENIPQEHKEFVANLDLFWENDTHFACHGYYPPSVPSPNTNIDLKNDAELVEAMLWDRFPKDWSNGCLQVEDYQWGKIGVFGHTPVSYYKSTAPIKIGNLRLIDTNAFRNEYLCAYNVRSDSWMLQATDERDIENDNDQKSTY